MNTVKNMAFKVCSRWFILSSIRTTHSRVLATRQKGERGLACSQIL